MAAKKQAAKAQEPELEQHLTRIQTSCTPLAEWKQKTTIKTEDEFLEAGEALRLCKELLNETKEERKRVVDPLKKHVKYLSGRIDALSDPLEALEKHLKQALIGPYMEQKRQAALKAVEKKAEKLEAKGQGQYADDLREAALTQAVPAIEGLRERELWRARITDLTAFLRAMEADHPTAALARDAVTEVIVKAMAAVARVSKNKAAAPPGVEFFTETSQSMTL